MKVTGTTTIEKARASSCTRTATRTEATSTGARPTARGSTRGPMVRTTLATGRTARRRAKGAGRHRMGIRTWVSGSSVRPMVGALMCGLTVISTRESGGTFLSMEKAPTSSRPATSTLASTCEAGLTVGESTLGPMVLDTWVNSRMGSNTAEDIGIKATTRKTIRERPTKGSISWIRSGDRASSHGPQAMSIRVSM